MKINRQDTNGVKPLLAVGELGYDNYPSGGDIGRVYVGTGSSNIAQAKKSEVVTVDGKVDTHVARIDNPHGVTKTQVGLSNVDNTSDVNKPVSIAVQSALDTKQDVLVSGTNVKTIEGQSIVGSGNIDLSKSAVGLDNVDNTADSLKVVASAGKWTTSRLINGTAVDGTTDVITSQWGTSRNITIGNTLKTVNGSGNVSWTLTEIGAIGTSSPAFTGTPTAPTAALGTSNTVIATTEFVNAEIANDAIPRVVSTDNAIVRFDGVTGAVQNSGVVIDDNNNVSRTVATGNANILLDVGTTGASNYIRFKNTADNDVSFVYNIGSELRITQATATANSRLVFCTQDIERMRIDSAGNVLFLGRVLVTGGVGLGYGTGSGGTVTQLTSKSTAVTLNKPSGQIIMNNAALAAGGSVTFNLNNSLLSAYDTLCISMVWNVTASYRFEQAAIGVGVTLIRVTNISGSSLSEAVPLNFNVIKGTIS